MTLVDSLQIAFRTIKGNKLRTGITVTIIALGIMALIGIVTATEAMNQSLKESFSFMGANAFSIRYQEGKVRIGRNNDGLKKSDKGKKEKASNLNKYIKKYDAELFKNNLAFPANVSISIRGGRSIDCHYESKKTNPVTTVMGGDENYLMVNGYVLLQGRNLNALDVSSGRNVCILGSSTASKLFGDEHPEQCIDKVIRVGGMPYRVIGLLKSKGASSFLRQDDVVITSYTNAYRLTGAAPSFNIGVMVNDFLWMEPAIDETTAAFRAIRKLQPTDADNFVIEKSDKVAEIFIGFLSSITGSAVAIGMITLIGAAIGLMNIMLVSVNERTREVGLIKAIGGKSRNVRQQFLFESIMISLLGAVFGILLGVLLGNAVAILMKTGFVVPWRWVFFGILICTAVGLIAGLYPAYKASKLNPINALRAD